MQMLHEGWKEHHANLYQAADRATTYPPELTDQTDQEGRGQNNPRHQTYHLQSHQQNPSRPATTQTNQTVQYSSAEMDD